jgi:hypothetical protein
MSVEKYTRRRVTNKDARIVTEYNSGARITRTAFRSEGTLKVSVKTQDNFTSLRVRFPDGFHEYFNGREARTIYRALKAHYSQFGTE